MSATVHVRSKLSADQKELVRRVLESEPRSLWIDRLALSVPVGLGMRLSESTLYRLKRQFELEDNLSDRESIKEQARAVANEEQNATLDSAALTLLREKAFALAASDSATDLRTACHIIRHLNGLTKKQSDISAKDASNEVPPEQTESFHRRVAKTVLLHFAVLGSIRGNKNLSEEQKQQMVMDRLFTGGNIFLTSRAPKSENENL